jgi:hypothetical protein
MCALLAALALPACGDPPPDIAVRASSMTSGLNLSVQICKLMMPGVCGPPTPLLDGSHETGQGGIYDLKVGDSFPLAFLSDASTLTDKCLKTVVTFHAAQQVINVSISSTSIDITCDSPDNCGPVVQCVP